MANQDPAHLRLKIWRVRAGVTQMDLAARLSITNGSLCRIEAGEYPPGADLKARILAETSVDWDEPVDLATEPEAPEDVAIEAAGR